MGSIQLELRRQLFRCCLVLAVLTSLASAANARPGFSASEHYPGPWLEITQEIREVLALHKISACNQAAGRQSSRKAGNISYIARATRKSGPAGTWSLRHAKCADPASSSKTSRHLTAIKASRSCCTNVRFGSKADICSAKAHVRFTPESGHVQCNLVCPLSANSGRQTLLCCLISRVTSLANNVAG